MYKISDRSGGGPSPEPIADTSSVLNSKSSISSLSPSQNAVVEVSECQNLNFGPHLTLDLSGCNPRKVKDLDLVFKLLNNLPEKIGMNKITQPYVFRYSGLVPEDRGITGMIIIAESHISVHTFEKKGYVFVDIFSCKYFDYEFAAKYVAEIFEASGIDKHIVQRGISFPRTNPVGQ